MVALHPQDLLEHDPTVQSSRIQSYCRLLRICSQVPLNWLRIDQHGHEIRTVGFSIRWSQQRIKYGRKDGSLLNKQQYGSVIESLGCNMELNGFVL
jgi:hypothetical protein